MKKDLICIVCPRGCALTARLQDGQWSVSGNCCPRGAKYAVDECTNPVRTVTSVLRIANTDGIMVSVKTAEPVAKNRIGQVMEILRNTSVEAPVHIGDVLIQDVCGVKILATKNID